MACVYKYNDQWLSEEEVLKVLSERKEFKSLYQNLLKELESGKGEEILNRVKRDYVRKFSTFNYESLQQEEKENIYYNWYYDWIASFENEDENENEDEDEREYQYPSNAEKEAAFNKYIEDKSFSGEYTLEEQQEEAIVELMSLMTAEKLDKVKDKNLISSLKQLLKEMKQFIRALLSQREVEIDKLPTSMTINDLSDLLAYSNNKLILPGYEVEYTTPDDIKFKTYQEASNHISELTKSIKDVDLNSITLEDVDLSKIDYFEHSYIEEHDGKIHTVVFKKENNVWFSKVDYDNKFDKVEESHVLTLYREITGTGLIYNFLERNMKYEKAKHIIEEWKKVNNIQYNPEEVYSRGQEFVSVLGAFSKFDVNLMLQNLLSHIEDNQKAGGKFTVSAFTKPVDERFKHLEQNGGKIRFKIYPQSEDILWAANFDAKSGSVWDANEKMEKRSKAELAGVSYLKYPSYENLDIIKPNLAEIIDDIDYSHNEIAIALTYNNFELEYDDDIPYQTKKIIDSVNSILKGKRGGNIVKPLIEKNTNNSEIFQEISEIAKLKHRSVFFDEDLDDYIDTYTREHEDRLQTLRNLKIEGITPIQTKSNITESISKTKDRLYSIFADKGGYVEQDNNVFNYTEQTLINTKIVALKEAAKKYPRSLIRSEVKKIEDTTSSYEDYEDDIFQKLPSVSPSTDEIKYNDKGEVLAPNGEVSILYKDIELLVEEQNKEQGNLRENIIDIANNSKWEHNRRLASFLLDSNFGINSFFKFVGDSMYDDLLKLGGWGLYYKDDNGVKQINIYSVLINKYFENDIERQKYYEEEVILHETVHLIVHEGLNANEDIENKLIDLMDFVKTKIDTSKYSNAFKNVQEFVAEAFTNAKFQVELKKIKYKGKLTIWNKFIELINIMAKSLGINTEYSVLEEIVSLTDILFNENKQLSLQLYKQTRSKEFKEWFGDSKVVDKNGEPLVVYHGANSEFDIFNKGNIFFTDNKEYARGFAENNVHDKIIEGLDYDVIVMPAFLRLVNPKNVDYKIHHITLNEDKFDGYDGIIGKEAVEYDINDYIAFEPKQIKSVFNQGTFSKENDNIDYYEKLPSTSPFEEFQKSLNKPDTNPVLLNNKEEQDKKFKELQEKLQDETFLEAVKSVFDNSSKLQQFAYETFLPDEDTSMKLSSKEEVLSLYTDYVAKIALGIIKNPSSGEYNDSSKVTDILHHGVTRGEVKDFDKFSDINQSSGTWGKGYYFAPTSNKFFVNAPIEKYVIVNSKKVITEKEHKTLFEEYKKRGFQGTVGLADTDNMFKEVREKYDTIDARERELIVFNPDQIHILDSKQDIEGFEKYIFNKSKQSPVEVLDNTEEIAEADNSPVSITPKKEVIQLPKTAQLILPIGISGSGKSTWISSLDKNKYTIISPDEIRKELTGDVSDNSRNIEIFKIVDDRILEALKKGDKVILDATNLNTTFRRLMITNLKSLYPRLDIRYKLLDVDPEIAKQRIANDISNKVDRSKTPDEIIDLQYQQYLQSKLDIKDEPIYEFNNERTAITDLLDRYSKNDNSLRKLTNIAAISGKTQNISNVPIVKDTDNINENIITMAKYGRTVRELLAIYPSLTEHFKGINLDTKLSDYIKQQEIEKQVTDYVEAIKQDMADNFSDYEDYLSKIDVYTIDDLYNYPNEKLLNDLCINGNLSK